MSSMVDILPILPRGHVLAVGQATKMPIRISVSKIFDESHKPDSDDPPFGEKWKVKIEERCVPNIEEICNKWIRSEKPDPDAKK
jgi:hypothetical protein